VNTSLLKMKKYKSVSSDRQVGTVRRCNQAGDYYRLSVLIASFIRKQHYNGHLAITDKFLYQYNGDHNLYCRIRDLNPPRGKKGKYEPVTKYFGDRSYVGQNYAKFIKEVSDVDFTHAQYLDFGCGTGIKSMSVAEQLEIPVDNVYGVDVRDWSVLDERTARAVYNMNYVDEGEPLPFESGQFDLISAFSVLHHVKNIEGCVKELARCLCPGGYLIIREHNVEDTIDQMIIEIQHRIFDYIKIPGFDRDNPPDYIKCYSMDVWKSLFGTSGLVCVKVSTDWYNKHTQECTKLFHAIFQKPPKSDQ